MDDGLDQVSGRDVEMVEPQAHDRQERYYISFAGGGAKGLVHVGALKYLEEQNLNICGVSGASAGALIATLHAIGYRADEIVGEHGRSRLFTDIRNTDYCRKKGLSEIRGIDALFNQGLMNTLKLMRLPIPPSLKLLRAAASFGSPLELICWVLTRFIMAVCLGGGVAGFSSRLIAEPVSAVLLGGLAGALVCFACLYLTLTSAKSAVGELLDSAGDKVLSGLSDIEIFRGIFAELISRKVHGDSKKVVTFKDVPKLHIILTDVHNGQAVAFSSKTHGSHSVADALCASMAIPGLFGIQNIDGDDFYDGGVVSNLPAWVFGMDARMDSRAKVIAINIVSDEKKRRADIETLKEGRGLKRLSAAVSLLGEALTGGSQKIHLRAENGIREFVIPTSLGTPDFDADADQRASAVENGKIALSRMMEFCRSGPEAYARLCDIIRDDAVGILQDIYKLLNSSVVVSRENVRVSVAMPAYQRPDLIRLKFSSGFYRYSELMKRWIPHPDLGLVLPADRSIAGKAIVSNAPIFQRLSHSDVGFLDINDDHDTICKILEEVSWVYAEPIKTEGAGDQTYAISIDGVKGLTDFEEYTDEGEAKALREYFFETVRKSIELNLTSISDTRGVPSMEECDDAHRR